MKKYILIITWLFSSTLIAQPTDIPWSVKGSISKYQEDIPFSKVQIHLYFEGRFQNSISTDSTGDFWMKLKYYGQYILVIQHKGFITDTIKHMEPSRMGESITSAWYNIAVSLDTLPNSLLEEYSISMSKSIETFPNPTTGIIHISELKTIDKLVLLDLGGNVLKTLKTEDNTSMELDLSSFSRGVYFLHYIDQGIPKVKRIIKL
jgi:hypothetical protein